MDKEPLLPGADKQIKSKTISCFRGVTMTGTFQLATNCPDGTKNKQALPL